MLVVFDLLGNVLGHVRAHVRAREQKAAQRRARRGSRYLWVRGFLALLGMVILLGTHLYPLAGLFAILWVVKGLLWVERRRRQ
jgi:fatty acid desaturase